MGKILGGGLGFVLGGPIGAVFGAVLGHHAVDSGRQEGLFSSLEKKQSIFFVATFSMLAKIAKADGAVTQHEIDVIEQVMRNNLRLSPQARTFAVEVFNEAKDSPQSFEEYARQFHQEFHGVPQVLISEIELLMLVAFADGQLHTEEEVLIRNAARIFGIEDQYNSIKARFVGQPDDIGRYYEILGAKQGDPLPEIKKKYRKLAMEFHPDRVQSQGVSPEFASAAEENFKEIQHAYDLVEKDIKGG